MKTGLSDERANYLRAIKRRKQTVVFLQIAVLVVFFAWWEVGAQFGFIDSFLFSSPSRILKTFANFGQNHLLMHIGTTVYETVVGFVLGSVLGMIAAIALWYSKLASDVVEPYLVVLNALPKVALGPIIIIWVGAGTGAIIAMALAISMIVCVLGVLGGFLQTDPDLQKMARTFGATKSQLFVKIILPAGVPALFSSLKIGIGLSLVGVITGEFLVSKAGLGYLIVYGGQVFQMDLVMSSVFILAVMAALMYWGIAFLEKKITPGYK